MSLLLGSRSLNVSRFLSNLVMPAFLIEGANFFIDAPFTRLVFSRLAVGLLAVASPLAANAEAVQVFAVQTAQPSVMDFRGLGTATYSNSTGTSNGITLGSTSSFNVSNNLAASKEYTGATSALVQFTGENAANRTNFQQSIGTSAGAANSISAAESTAYFVEL